MTRRPCSLSSSRRSAISLTTIAVELIASAAPSAIALCQPRPQWRPVAVKSEISAALPASAAAIVSTTWLRPRPKTSFLMLQQLGQVELEADDEHQEDDAELGQIADAGGIAGQADRARAEGDADRQIAEHRRQPGKAADHDACNGGDEEDQRQFERRGHAVGGVRRCEP